MASNAATVDVAPQRQEAIWKRLIALTVTLASFMEVLDTGIASILAAHRWQPVGQPGRSDMGIDVLLGFERHYSAVERMVVPNDGTAQLLHGLRGCVYSQFFPVRHRA